MAWSDACLKVGFQVAPGVERRVRARAVTRVQWGFRSPQVRGNDSGSVWIRGSGLVCSGFHRWLSRARLVEVDLDSCLYNTEVE